MTKNPAEPSSERPLSSGGKAGGFGFAQTAKRSVWTPAKPRTASRPEIRSSGMEANGRYCADGQKASESLKDSGAFAVSSTYGDV